MPSVPESPEVVSTLREAKRIAVIGLSPRLDRPSHSVSRYLQRAGYTIIPVRPGPDGTILGEPIAHTLQEAAARGPIDIVDVFRRSSAIPELVDDILAVRPRLVWLQVGVVHEAAAARLEAAGIPVVMDHCLAVVHHSSLGG
jgi:predicted CoA-binding protein